MKQERSSRYSIEGILRELREANGQDYQDRPGARPHLKRKAICKTIQKLKRGSCEDSKYIKYILSLPSRGAQRHGMMACLEVSKAEIAAHIASRAGTEEVGWLKEEAFQPEKWPDDEWDGPEKAFREVRNSIAIASHLKSPKQNELSVMWAKAEASGKGCAMSETIIDLDLTRFLDGGSLSRMVDLAVETPRGSSHLNDLVMTLAHVVDTSRVGPLQAINWAKTTMKLCMLIETDTLAGTGHDTVIACGKALGAFVKRMSDLGDTALQEEVCTSLIKRGVNSEADFLFTWAFLLVVNDIMDKGEGHALDTTEVLWQQVESFIDQAGSQSRLAERSMDYYLRIIPSVQTHPNRIQFIVKSLEPKALAQWLAKSESATLDALVGQEIVRSGKPAVYVADLMEACMNNKSTTHSLMDSLKAYGDDLVMQRSADSRIRAIWMMTACSDDIPSWQLRMSEAHGPAAHIDMALAYFRCVDMKPGRGGHNVDMRLITSDLAILGDVKRSLTTLPYLVTSDQVTESDIVEVALSIANKVRGKKSIKLQGLLSRFVEASDL